ncbi:MAG: PilN domain-containing protein [Candidatus Omnitrophica bacterium]|nr:PilN domain-containing protein [Candidatus Omnitrophota bacterium]
MIDINLVPEQFRKRRRSELLSGGVFNIPREVLFGIGGGILALMFLVDGLFFAVKIFKFLEYQHVKAKWQDIQPDKSTMDTIKQNLQEVQKEVKAIKDITDGQSSLWSQKLNAISSGLPKGVWLRKVTLTDKQLFIEGSTVAQGQSEVINVGSFVSNLKKDTDFTQDFETIEVDYIQSRKTEGLQVSDFTILAKLK